MDTILDPGTPSATALKLAPWIDFDESAPVDYHMHTTYTDGTSSPMEMAQAAQSQGLSDIMFTDHVRHSSTYLPDLAREVIGLEGAGLKTRVGVETKVLDTEGRLDCSPETASMCEGIIGSVHRPPDGRGGVRDWAGLQPEEAVDLEFGLAMAIVARSRAHILGHPMGMAVTRFAVEPLQQLYELAVACLEFDKAFELNPRYCSNPKEWIAAVRNVGCKVSFGSDAHAKADVGSAWRRFMFEFQGARQ